MRCKDMFWLNLGIMKKILDVLEFKFGKKSEEFKFMKKQIMNYFYMDLDMFYKNLVKNKIAIKCTCKATIRKGYNSCNFCGGCGYKEI